MIRWPVLPITPPKDDGVRIVVNVVVVAVVEEVLGFETELKVVACFVRGQPESRSPTQADLTFTDSVIDELTANGNAQVTVRNSEVYADWLSLGGDARLQMEHSTVGARRLADERPDLATSEIRPNGRSQASLEDVNFDCDSWLLTALA